MVKVNGLFIAMKANIEEEIENSIRNIIMIQKQKTTNNLYPRRIEKMK